MNEYNVKVNFEKGQIITNLKKLVQNDYNSTKLNFTFDKEGRVLFKMSYPDGTQYVDEIENNELIFGKGVLNQEGTYEYEISLYTEDGRLTDHAIKSFEVRSELVNTDELVEPDDRVPVLDKLINEVTAIKTDVEEGKYNGKDGSDGQDGVTPTIGENGNWFIGNTDTGLPSQGPEGKPGPAGGVSLEEVTAITGELENLGTEDKSNLVNAINEVLANGGGITELTDYTVLLSSLEAGVYLLKGVTWLQYGSSLTYSYSLSSNLSSILIVVKNGVTPFGYVFDRGYITCISSNLNYYNPKKIDLRKIITSDNKTEFTPTEDYNPVHKKYVDDAITNAITTTLEGSY